MLIGGLCWRNWVGVTWFRICNWNGWLDCNYLGRFSDGEASLAANVNQSVKLSIQCFKNDSFGLVGQYILLVIFLDF